MKTTSSWLLVLVVMFAAACELNPSYCAQGSDCKDPQRPYCSLPARQCVATLPDGGVTDIGADEGVGDMRPSGDLVEPDLMPPPDLMPACTVATAATACAASLPVCDSTSQTCRVCASTADDAVCMARDASKGHCEFTAGPNLGHCVACAASAQCAQATPVCELAATNATRNTCRGCTSHAECGTGKLCNFGDIDALTKGQCVSPVVVDKNAAGGCKTSGSGAQPWCEIQQALDGEATPSSGPLYVLVNGPVAVGSEYAKAAITDTSTNKSVVLVGQSSPTVLDDKQIGFRINVSSGTASVVLESLTFGQPLGTGSNNLKNAGIQCVGTGATATLLLRTSTVQQVLTGPGVTSTDCTTKVSQSTISGNAGAGISASNGSLSVSQSTISGNAGAGISAANVPYTIVNNFLVSNGTTGGDPGVLLSGTSAGTFQFNTVTQNGGLVDSPGGVQCPTAGLNRKVEWCIVFNNAKTSGTQFTGKCQLTQVVVGTDSTIDTEAIKNLPPQFVSSTDVHLQNTTPNNDCCIGKVAQASCVPVDRDGDKRPQGTATTCDIGADEVVK